MSGSSRSTFAFEARQPLFPEIIELHGRWQSRDEVKTWCNERVGRRQRIADVVFVDELPRNPNGKVLKRVLRTRFGDLHYD